MWMKQKRGGEEEVEWVGKFAFADDDENSALIVIDSRALNWTEENCYILDRKQSLPVATNCSLFYHQKQPSWLQAR